MEEGRQLCNQVVLILEPHLELVLILEPHLLAWVGCSAASFVAVERALDQYWRSSLAGVLVHSYPFLHPTRAALHSLAALSLPTGLLPLFSLFFPACP